MALETLTPDTLTTTVGSEDAASNLPVGKAVASKNSAYALPSSTSPTGVDAGILKRMEQMIAERESQRGSLLESMKDASAWFSGGMNGPSAELRARAAEREGQEATTFGMRRDLAQYQSQQGLVKTAQADVFRALGMDSNGKPVAGGVGSASMDPFAARIDPTVAAQIADLAKTDPIKAKAELLKHTAEMAKPGSIARFNKDTYAKGIEVKTPEGIDLISVEEYLKNPELYQPTPKGRAAIKADMDDAARNAQRESGNNPNIGFHDLTKGTAYGTYGITKAAYQDIQAANPKFQGRDIASLSKEEQTEAFNTYRKLATDQFNKLGVPVTPQNLDLAHFLGAAGAARYLKDGTISEDAAANNGGPVKAKQIANAILAGKQVSVSGAATPPAVTKPLIPPAAPTPAPVVPAAVAPVVPAAVAPVVPAAVAPVAPAPVAPVATNVAPVATNPAAQRMAMANVSASSSSPMSFDQAINARNKAVVPPVAAPVVAPPVAPAVAPALAAKLPGNLNQQLNALNKPAAPAAAPVTAGPPPPIVLPPEEVVPPPVTKLPAATPPVTATNENLMNLTIPQLRARAKGQEEEQVTRAKERTTQEEKLRPVFEASIEPFKLGDDGVAYDRAKRLVLTDPSIASVIASSGYRAAVQSIIKEGLTTPKGTVTIGGLEDAIFKTLQKDFPNLSQARREELKSILARMELNASQLIDGQGAISQGERAVLKTVSLSVSDRPETIYKRMEMLERRNKLDKQIAQMYGDGSNVTSVAKFKLQIADTPEYKQYLKDIRAIANKDYDFSNPDKTPKMDLPDSIKETIKKVTQK